MKKSELAQAFHYISYSNVEKDSKYCGSNSVKKMLECDVLVDGLFHVCHKCNF